MNVYNITSENFDILTKSDKIYLKNYLSDVWFIEILTIQKLYIILVVKV